MSYHLPSGGHWICLVLHGRRLIGRHGCSRLSLIPEHGHVALCWRQHPIAGGERHCKEQRSTQVMTFVKTFCDPRTTHRSLILGILRQ